MAFCTQCGIIMHDDDASSHVCDVLDLPTKGQAKRLLRENK